MGPGVTAFAVDSSGDGTFAGTVTAPYFYIHSPKSEDAPVGAFLRETTRPSIEDDGTARLSEGRSVVRFDAAFAATIEARAGYQVFLSPQGDTRGLYVAQKFADGFVVRETLGGRSSIPFDYCVVARPLGTTS